MRHAHFQDLNIVSYRVYAIYNRNKIILYGLSASLLMQTVAGLWEFTVRGSRGEPCRSRDLECSR
jgi:hypothetical protein